MKQVKYLISWQHITPEERHIDYMYLPINYTEMEGDEGLTTWQMEVALSKFLGYIKPEHIRIESVVVV